MTFKCKKITLLLILLISVNMDARPYNGRTGMFIYISKWYDLERYSLGLKSFISVFFQNSVSGILPNPNFSPMSIQLPGPFRYQGCFTEGCLSQQRAVTREDKRTQEMIDFEEPGQFNQGQFPAQLEYVNETGANNVCSYHGCIRKLRLKRRNLLNGFINPFQFIERFYQSKGMPGQATLDLPYQISSVYPDNKKRFSEINNNRFIRLI